MRTRVEGTISEEAYKYFSDQCLANDRGASYLLDKVLIFARDQGYDVGLNGIKSGGVRLVK